MVDGQQFNYMKPKVLFFARAFHNEFCSNLLSEKYESVFVTLTKNEKDYLLKKGIEVSGCFEEDYEKIKISEIPDNYLLTSFLSDRFLSGRSYEKRQEILGKEISFWRNILTFHRPTTIVHETVAIEIAEVLYIEASKLNIPYSSFLLSNIVPGSFYWKPNGMNGVLDKSLFSNIKPTIEDREKAIKYLKDFREKFIKPKYIHQSIKQKRISLGRLKSYIKRDLIDFFNTIYYLKISNKFKYELRGVGFKNIKRYLISLLYKYDKLNTIENKEVFFYPFHVEPEATLAYFSEFYSNQAHTIENIVKCLGTNHFLVVKEHPQQYGALSMKKFRELKKKIPNLIFLKSEVPSEAIIEKSKAIITLTSNVGWEAMLLRKPVLILGEQYYSDAFPVTKVDSFSEVKRIIRNSLYKYPTDQEIIESISKFIPIIKKGLVITFQDTDLDENNKFMIKAIEELVEEIRNVKK